MAKEKRNIRFVFVIFWLLLAYIMAALLWWVYELYTQNTNLSLIKVKELATNNSLYQLQYNKIINQEKSNNIQYILEGATFLLLMIAGAIYIYRGFLKELRFTRDQRNFMMAITHELKTPIAVAKLNLETLQKHKLTEAQQKQILGNTLQEANRMDNLCNNLLVSSQIEAGKYTLVKEEQNLSDLINTCVNEFITRHPLRIFAKNIASEIYATGDLFLLQIAFNNLLENAIKYSPKEKPISILFEKIETNAVLKVIDEGAGVSDADKKLVFEKFYRTGNEATKRAKGTGLGLFLTSRIAKTHEGNIKIEDNPNGGSIFILTLKANA
jgi:two-component system, OmpR family, sensor histidine kinase CiaH